MIQLSPCMLFPVLTSLLPEDISPWLFSSDQCLRRFPCYFSHSLQSSVPSMPWLSGSCLYMSGQHLCIVLRSCVPASTAIAFSFYLSVWPAGPCTALQSFLSPQFLMLGDGELLCSLKNILEVLLAILHSFAHKDSLLGDLIQLLVKQMALHSCKIQGPYFSLCIRFICCIFQKAGRKVW